MILRREHASFRSVLLCVFMVKIEYRISKIGGEVHALSKMST